MIEGHEVDPGVLAEEAPDAVHVIEHPPLKFISYPYSWSFDGLQAAALLTLDLHVEALGFGLTLSDASAYNIQFVGSRPIFIDYLSPILYEEGQVWLGYRQFCEQFLNPLLLTARTGVPFHPWYRGAPEGIPAAELSAILPFRAKIHPLIALHVAVQGRLQRAVTARRTAVARNVRISRTALVNNLESMRRLVAGLRPPRSQRSPWENYEQTAQYSVGERAAKAEFVRQVVAATQPRMLWDLGCNAGEYAELALESGASAVIGLEPDPGALNAAFRRASAKGLNFLPLAVDLLNPPPSLGWRQQERLGLAERCNADFLLCLALLHHLVLGRNLPLSEVIEWLTSLAPKGIIEFVPRTDPMAQQLVSWKPTVAPDYDLSTVKALLGARVRIDREEAVTTSGRVLLAFSEP